MNPVRIFEGTAKPHEPFWTLRNAAESESGTPEIEFYGTISEFSWFEDDITPAMFKADLNRIGGGGPVTVRIHSGGGDVFAASAIRAILMEYPGAVTTRIDGLCASAATYVATAGDQVLIQDSAFFMIHDPWTIAWGGVDDLKAAINLLKTIKDGIIDVYQGKTHLGEDELARMMANETWMTAQQALEYGFVDEVVREPRAKAKAAPAILNCLRNYSHVPAELFADNIAEDDGGTTEAEMVEDVPGEGAEEIAEPVTEEAPEPAANGDRADEDARQLRDYLEVFGPKKE